MIKKTIKNKLRRQHEVLFEVLQGYRNSKSNATNLTPYRLTYGQDAVFLLELAMSSLRVAKQHRLQPKKYSQAMFQELELVDEDRVIALENIQANKAKVSKLYNKMVKFKCVIEGDLVWKVILPRGTRTDKFGK